MPDQVAEQRRAALCERRGGLTADQVTSPSRSHCSLHTSAPVSLYSPRLNLRFFFSTKFGPMEKLGVLKTTFEKINSVSVAFPLVALGHRLCSSNSPSRLLLVAWDAGCARPTPPPLLSWWPGATGSARPNPPPLFSWWPGDAGCARGSPLCSV